MKTNLTKTENGVIIATCGHAIVRITPTKMGQWNSYRLVWKVGRKSMRRAISNEEKAIAEASRIAEALFAGEGEKARVNGADISYFLECKKKLQGVELHTAIDFYIKYHGLNTGEEKTFEVVSEEFLEDRKKKKRLAGKPDKGDRYLDTLRSHINTWQSVFSEKNIKTLTAPVIANQLIDVWMDKYSLVSKWKLLGTLGSIMRFAQTKNYISREHISTSGVELPRPPLKTPEIFTPEELMKILICVKPDAIPYFTIMAFGGGRRSELEKSPMENLNLEDGKLFIAPEIAKKNSGRALKIQENLDLWLTEFAKYDGKLVRSERLTNPCAYKEKFDKVGITWKHNGLRHSFCTYFTELTDNPVLASRLAGNSQKMLDKHYVSSNVSNAAAQAWFSITPESVRQYANKNNLDGLLTW